MRAFICICVFLGERALQVFLAVRTGEFELAHRLSGLWGTRFSGGRISAAGLCSAVDEGLGFAQENVGDQPVLPTLSQVVAAELRQFGLRDFEGFG
jgi:hypothetical protein